MCAVPTCPWVSGPHTGSSGAPHIPLPHHALSLVAASAELASPPTHLLPDLHFQSSTSQQGGVFRSLWKPCSPTHHPPPLSSLKHSLWFSWQHLQVPALLAWLSDCSVTSRHVFSSGFNHRTLKIAPSHCSCHPVPGKRIKLKKEKKKKHKYDYENNLNLHSFAAQNSFTCKFTLEVRYLYMLFKVLAHMLENWEILFCSPLLPLPQKISS